MSATERRRSFPDRLISIFRGPASEREHRTRNKDLKRMLDAAHSLENGYNRALSVEKISFGQDAGDRRKLERAMDRFAIEMMEFDQWLRSNQSFELEVVITLDARQRILEDLSDHQEHFGSIAVVKRSVNDSVFDKDVNGHVVELGRRVGLSVPKQATKFNLSFIDSENKGTPVVSLRPSEVKAIRVVKQIPPRSS